MSRFNLSILLEESARRAPDHLAVVCGPARLSYRALQGAVCQVAAFLAARGIGPGDRVALTCPNLPWFPIVYHGILRSGAAVVPLNVLFKAREIAYHLRDARVRAHFCFEGSEQVPMLREAASAWAEVPECDLRVAITLDPAAASPLPGVPTLGACLHGQPAQFPAAPTLATDTAVLLYTSGTTGQPKGAELSHSNLLCNALLCRDLLRYTREDVNLIALPLFHSFGQTVQMNGGFFAGCTQVLLPRFDPVGALRAMQAERVTVFCGVPTMYWALMGHEPAPDLDLPAIAARLRLCVSGGAALPLEVLRGFEERFQAPILEGYGLSETSPVACFNQLDAPRKPGTIGTPVWGVDMRVVDEADRPLPPGQPGEVVIRGHNVMKGYFGRPEETAEVIRDGWLHTGDVGVVDEDGYFRIVDRLKDLIIRGGFNVYPREVEEVLLTHPALAQAAVIGVPDARVGEEIVAVVTLKPGASATPESLVAWARDILAAYKYPRQFHLVERLPLNATGKVLKRELRAAVSACQSSPQA
jgi:long-chain acyl-CoA synthetase